MTFPNNTKITLPIHELLQLRDEGLTHKQMAEHFGCGATTVHRHLAELNPDPQPAKINFPVYVETGWLHQSRCLDTDPEQFFPENGASDHMAKKVCGACPVRTECLDAAIARREEFGIWGGLNTAERRRYANGELKEKVCEIAECAEIVPLGAHPKQIYCSRRHNRLAAERRNAARKREAA